MPFKYSIADMQELAKLRGGQCLSKEYRDTYSPLLWKCKSGHTWETNPSYILQGSWCVQCLRSHNKEQRLDDLREIAESKGGKCLSTKYIDAFHKLEFECKEKHRWWAAPHKIRNDGSWCRVCSGHPPLTLEDMQALAKSRGGKCLSKKYVSTKKKLLWECKEGHRWNSTPSVIRAGHWCIICKGRLLTIEQMQAIAKERGGKCLSKRYKGAEGNLLWECKKGHRWDSSPHVIKKGGWCSICKGRLLTLEEMQAIAKSNGGKCLSKNYVNTKTKLEWECSEGHRWKAMPGHIKRGHWCPYCTGHVRLTIGEMQAIAKSRGGKCLSKRYSTSSVKLLWECKEGHRWKATARDVKYSGSWCAVCARCATLTIAEMQAIAKSRGGKCLSKTYINNQTKLEWQCKEGHRWEAAPTQVKYKERWCPVCLKKTNE